MDKTAGPPAIQNLAETQTAMKLKAKTRLFEFIFSMLGLATLYIGVPRFLSELVLVPGTAIIERYSYKNTILESDLDTVEKSRKTALKLSSLPKAYTDLGLIYLLRFQTTKSSDDRTNFLDQSIANTKKGLSLAPNNPFAWFRLNSALLMLAEPKHSEALEAWNMSIATAKFEPLLMVQRIHLGLLLYDRMDKNEKDTLQEQFQLAYKWDREKLKNYTTDFKLDSWMLLLAHKNPEIAAFFSN
jgi:tetratricopeptide (TPR) repeat protein